MATTPTSLALRLMGQEACTDGLVVQGASAQFVAIPAGTTTLTMVRATHAGKLLLVASTGGLAITPLPATGTGDIYDFLVITAISGGTFSIDAKAGAAADVFMGGLYGGTSGTGAVAWPTAANSNFIQFNATTTGGLAGTRCTIQDIATNKWMVQGTIVSSGTAATPFSNH